MNRSKKSSVIFILLLVGTALGMLGVFGNMHARSQRRYLVSAVGRQIDSHASIIADLLSEANGRSPAQIAELV